MNDKRCPACDLLVDEGAAECQCDFVFWDNTPEHQITRKRIIVTFSLLVGAGFLGAWLSFSSFITIPSMMSLSLVPFALLLLPNLRKQGGCALTIAILLVFWVSTFIAYTWKQQYPNHNFNPLADTTVYNSNRTLTIDGIGVGKPAPGSPPKKTVFGKSRDGKVTFVVGDRLLQDGEELLRVGDLSKRFVKKFPREEPQTGFHKLGYSESLFVVITDDRIAEIALFDGICSLGEGPEIQNVRIGMSRSFVEYSLPDPDSRPKVFYAGKPETVDGMYGINLKTEYDVQIERGQAKSSVPKAETKSREQIISVKYDEQDKVAAIYCGEIRDGSLVSPSIEPNESKSLGLKLLSQECLETDSRNEPTAWVETWKLPDGSAKLFIRFPNERESNKDFGWGEYTAEEAEVEPYLWSVGEASHWTWDERTRRGRLSFISGGRIFDLDFSSNASWDKIDLNRIRKMAESVAAGSKQ